MTERLSAPRQRTRIGTWVAMAVAAVSACFTLLLFGTAIRIAFSLAADHELYGSTGLIVAWIAALGAISGLATAYLIRRIVQDRRQAP